MIAIQHVADFGSSWLLSFPYPPTAKESKATHVYPTRPCVSLALSGMFRLCCRLAARRMPCGPIQHVTHGRCQSRPAPNGHRAEEALAAVAVAAALVLAAATKTSTVRKQRERYSLECIHIHACAANLSVYEPCLCSCCLEYFRCSLTCFCRTYLIRSSAYLTYLWVSKSRCLSHSVSVSGRASCWNKT